MSDSFSLRASMVHLADERLHRARRVHRQRIGGVVGRGDQHGRKHVMHADLAARVQADREAGLAGHRRGHHESPVDAAALGQEGGHQLGEARDRPARVRAVAPQHATGAGIDDDAGGDVHTGKRARGGAGRAQRRRHVVGAVPGGRRHDAGEGARGDHAGGSIGQRQHPPDDHGGGRDEDDQQDHEHGAQRRNRRQPPSPAATGLHRVERGTSRRHGHTLQSRA